ncbi:MAG TPA: hypothetical protein VLL75_17900 [Vicinamibacteria bacterium]|nr:hypothetical protein [Vicinamibacteria bacterium]
MSDLEVHPSRWEHGSFFHLSLEPGVLEAPWNGGPSTLWGSGRDAMRALLAWGRETLGFERIVVPSFFCPKVTSALARELPVAIYPDAPEDPLPDRFEASARDVLLVVNTYGMRARPRVDTRAVVLEDHSHDPLSPWAFESEADYAVASLRKTLPLPDGGVLWSPKRRELPSERRWTATHARAAASRLAAMAWKRQYLEGLPLDKETYRARAIAAEVAIGTGEISGITPLSRERLPALPGRAWRDRRARNLAAFRSALGEVPGVRVLEAPFAATLVFDAADRREQVRAALVAARAYPAVLWPLEGDVHPDVPAGHRELSRRVLSLHCDFRYGEHDMERVAEAVRRAGSGGRGAPRQDREGIRRPGPDVSLQGLR